MSCLLNFNYSTVNPDFYFITIIQLYSKAIRQFECFMENVLTRETTQSYIT